MNFRDFDTVKEKEKKKKILTHVIKTIFRGILHMKEVRPAQ